MNKLIILGAAIGCLILGASCRIQENETSQVEPESNLILEEQKITPYGSRFYIYIDKQTNNRIIISSGGGVAILPKN